MNADWAIARATKTCAASGRKLEVGEAYFAALRETGEGFERHDFSPEAWPGVDKKPFFSYWRSKVPPDEEKRRRLVVDPEAFYAFYTGLEGAAEPRKQLFRYLAALILVRKRVLRLERVEKTPEGEYIVLYDRRTEKAVRVSSPSVAGEQLQEAQEALSRLFECPILPEDL